MADSGASLTPEKRLLKLIETGEKPTSAEPMPRPASSGTVRPAMAGGGTVEMGVHAQPFIPSLLEGVRSWTVSAKKYLRLKTVNQIARIVLVVFVLVAAANAGYEQYISMNKPLAGLDAPILPATTVRMDEEETDVSRLNLDELRNVFLPFAKREEVKPADQSSAPRRLLEMTRALKLTGISFNPDMEEMNYCMIEDLAKNITVFLRVGDRISGMQVSAIHDESIELEYDNEKIEFR